MLSALFVASETIYNIGLIVDLLRLPCLHHPDIFVGVLPFKWRLAGMAQLRCACLGPTKFEPGRNLNKTTGSTVLALTLVMRSAAWRGLSIRVDRVNEVYASACGHCFERAVASCSEICLSHFKGVTPGAQIDRHTLHCAL